MFDIGSSLRDARTRQDLDFPELEERTKIRPKYLRALEDERFDLLPSPTYVKGFLRSYADALGLDGQPFVDEYNSRFAVGDDELVVRARHLPPPRPRERSNRESRLAVVALAAIAIVTALVIAAWRFGGPEGEPVHGLSENGAVPTQAQPAAGRARLVVAAVDGSSWMEVRVSSSAGRLLYSGTLEQGQRKTFQGRRLQLAVAEPDNVVVRLNGNRVELPAGHGLHDHRPQDRPRFLSRPRAAIVVTGSELVRGDRQDRNGPFLAAEAVRLGLQPERIAIVGDGVADLERAFAQGLEADICLVSGGLGPTHDDRTVELVARAAGRGLVVDERLEREIEEVSRMVAERLNRPYSDFTTGVRKQATLPEGGISLGLAGTAPGIVLDTGSCVVVVLPGPPPELRRLWPRALETEPVRSVLARAPARQRSVLRFFGTPESAVAKALEEAGGDGDGVEVTICAREFEIHVDLVVEPGAEERGAEIERGLREVLQPYLFGEDERTIAEIVLDLCRERGLTLATAESCTGGLVAARLTSIPGSSAVFRGGVVAYADEVKERELGVPASLLAAHGAVSPEVAEAMALGARERLGVDVAVSVTGVAGPDGGTDEKPVGLVHLHASGPAGDVSRRLDLPGDREMVRGRATAAALHLVRRLLESRHTPA